MSDHQTDAERVLEVLRARNQGKALRPPAMGDKTLISVRISTYAKQRLQEIAEQLGYVHSGHGNISMLMEAIGTDTVAVDTNTDHTFRLR